MSGTSPCRKLNNYTSYVPHTPTNNTVAFMNRDTTSLFPNNLSHTSPQNPLCQLVFHLQRRTILHLLHIRLFPSRRDLRASSCWLTSRSFRRRFLLCSLATKRTVRTKQSTNVTRPIPVCFLLQLLHTSIPLAKTITESTHTLHVQPQKGKDGMHCIQSSCPNTRFPSWIIPLPT